MRNCTNEFFNIAQKETQSIINLFIFFTDLNNIGDIYASLGALAEYFKTEYRLEVYPRFVKDDRYYLMLHEQSSGSDVAIILC